VIDALRVCASASVLPMAMRAKLVARKSPTNANNLVFRAVMARFAAAGVMPNRSDTR
jgi:hypothetical protein